MSIGSSSAYSDTNGAGILRKAWSLFLAFSLALSLSPVAAWAVDESAEDSGGSNSSLTAAVDVPAASPATSSFDGSTASPDAASPNTSSPNTSPAAASSSNEGSASTPVVSPADNQPSGTGSVSPAETASRETEGADGRASAEVTATCSIIGIDAQGAQETWAAAVPYTLDSHASAADLTEALFAATGLTAQRGMGPYGWYLDSITSPTDPARTLAYDAATGKYWQLFINGAAATTGAGGYELKSNDSIVWFYSAYGSAAPTNQLSVSASLIGTDANGTTQTWAPVQTFALPQGSTAADLTEALFTSRHIAADRGTGPYGWYLSSITSPFDASMTLGLKEVSPNVYAYWQLFVNGVAAQTGAGSCVLAAGDVVTWRYGSDGTLPSKNEIVVDPSAERPAYDSSWPGYAAGMPGGAVVEAPTPVGEADTAWAQKLKESTAWSTNASDPIVVNGDIYLVVGNRLQVRDAATGALERDAALAAPIDSISRMAYADGLIIVPLSGGRLQALTADALKTVWLTAALPGTSQGGDQQSLTRLTISEGNVYYGTASADWSTAYGGFFRCVELATGRVMWSFEDETSGFYWSGAAIAHGFAVVADDAGRLRAIDGAGKTVSTLDLGARVRSGVVVGGSSSELFVVDATGILHKINLSSEGALSSTGTVKVASSSTATPAYVRGKVIVCGSSLEGYANSWGSTSYYGQISVVDADTLALEHSVSATVDGGFLPGDSKSTPLVSIQSGGTYVYFTCNAQPGGVYLYRVGDDTARQLFAPSGDQANYCMASVACGSDGTLYYVNDSGYLMAVKGIAAPTPDPGEPALPAPDQGGASSGDEAMGKGNGSANAPAAVGEVPASQTPLASSTTAKSAVASTSATTDRAVTASAENGQAAVAEEQHESDEVPRGGLNPWAIGGIALGVAGLAAAVGYLLVGRRARGVGKGEPR